VSVNPEKLDLYDFEELQQQLRDQAKEGAQDQIEMTIGEYFDPDVERKDWDYRGLARWAMSNFNVNMAISQMTRSEPEEIRQTLIEAALHKIDKFDCSPVQRFLEPSFPKAALAEWVRNKFNIDVRLNDIVDRSPNQIRDYVLERVEGEYHRREIECPVDIALVMSFGEEGTADRVHGASHLLNWAKFKYNVDWTPEYLQNKQISELRDELIQLSRKYLSDGQLTNEIDQALQVYQGPALAEWAKQRFGARLDPRTLEQEDPKPLLLDAGREFFRRELTHLEQMVLVNIYDSAWKEHLLLMDHLKGAIGLRGYAEKDPKIEYKREGTQMFHRMLDSVREQVTDVILKVQVSSRMQARSVWQVQQAQHAEQAAFSEADRQAGLQTQGEGAPKPIKRDKPKVGPNDPCPCGSGKKYKKCCGKAH
jgi:preprotein translocase subunit SecA